MSLDYIEMLITDPHITPEIQSLIQTFPALSRENQVKFFRENCGNWHEITTQNFYWQYIRPIEDIDDNELIIDEIIEDQIFTEEQVRELENQVADTEKRIEQYEVMLRNKRQEKFDNLEKFDKLEKVRLRGRKEGEGGEEEEIYL